MGSPGRGPCASHPQVHHHKVKATPETHGPGKTKSERRGSTALSFWRDPSHQLTSVALAGTVSPTTLHCKGVWETAYF